MTSWFCYVDAVTLSIQQHVSCVFQRLARLPKGPTLHFKVLKVNMYDLVKETQQMGPDDDRLILDC